MPESENEKMTIPQIREILTMLNTTARQRPPTTLADFESNRQALTSLVVELCDRSAELTNAAGGAIKRLTEETSMQRERIAMLEEQLGGIAQALQQASVGTPAAPVAATEGDLAAQFAEAQAALEQQAAPAPKKNGDSKKKPSAVAAAVAQPTVAPTPPPVAGDAAAVAAAMNGASGTPPAMAIVKQG